MHGVFLNAKTHFVLENPSVFVLFGQIWLLELDYDYLSYRKDLQDLIYYLISCGPIPWKMSIIRIKMQHESK